MILMRGDAANIYFQWKARHSEDSAAMNLYGLPSFAPG